MLEFRSNEQEQMDNLELSGDVLRQTLDGLSTINKYLGNTNITLKAVKMALMNSSSILSIIDLGCGGGDNLRTIATWAHQNKIQVKLTGIDGNKNIVEYGSAQNNDAIHIDFIQADILSKEFTLPVCDILISSHFIYHFSDEELVSFLVKSKERVGIKMIFSELQRSMFAYSLFRLGGKFLPFSKMVKKDGLKAIKRSYKRRELEHLFKLAGIAKYSIRWKWAFRYLVEVSC